jgi:type IV pilus assembly protein PilN
VILAAVLGANFYAWQTRSNADDKLQAQITRTRAQIAELDKVIQEVKDINKKEQDFKTKLEALNTLKAHRAGPVKILDALQTAVPKKVWITAAGEKGGAMALAGEALSQDDLAEFMSALQNVVDTPQGLGRLVIDERGKESRVELTSTGKIASFKPSEVTPFFTNVQLTGDAEASNKGLKTVKFTLTLSANYSA